MSKKSKKIKTEIPTPAELKQTISLIRAPSPVSTRWMWAGVILVSSIIILFWGWSIKLRLTALNWMASPEQNLIEKNKSAWDKIFFDHKEKEKELQQLKEIINRIIATSSTIKTETATSTTTTIKKIIQNL